jgi:hypothetical protein
MDVVREKKGLKFVGISDTTVFKASFAILHVCYVMYFYLCITTVVLIKISVSTDNLVRGIYLSDSLSNCT